MRTNYVRGASVSCSASQAEIRDMLIASGAHGVRFVSVQGNAGITFSSADRRFRLVLPLPAPTPGTPDPDHGPPRPESSASESKAVQDAARHRWRQLSLLIRAKLDAVDAGIVTFDEEFLAYVVMPGGGTVFQASAPGIAAAYVKTTGGVTP
ncbi:hypothetical protein [Sinomonas mesophila]|uniref:hypothetical protein n=1 Tax=Sinomonas mesophila TaxID=1531955 RepID=UPI001115ABC5|nr:hypothetical protein [Sinomonas mesophila]